MFGLPKVELLIRVRGRAERASNRVPRLRRCRDPLACRGHVWQLVVDVGVGYPALVDVLSTCQGFRVDDAHGNTVGVVEDVVMAPDSAGRATLIVRAWDRQWIEVPLDEVVEVAPGGHRLVTARPSARSR